MSQYFPKACSLYRDIKVEVDLSNSARKADAKEQQVLIQNPLRKKGDLASLKLAVN